MVIEFSNFQSQGGDINKENFNGNTPLAYSTIGNNSILMNN